MAQYLKNRNKFKNHDIALKLAQFIGDIVFYILAKFQEKILICKAIITFFSNKFKKIRWTDGGDFGRREEWKEEVKRKGSLNPFEPSSSFFFSLPFCRDVCIEKSAEPVEESSSSTDI